MVKVEPEKNNTEHLDRKIQERLEHLKSLEKGWYWDGEGEPVSEIAINEANKLISARPDLKSYYRLYPVPEGGISIEFEKSNLLISIYINNDGIVIADQSGIASEREFEGEFTGVNAEFLALFNKYV
jgi:hypothetical protein